MIGPAMTAILTTRPVRWFMGVDYGYSDRTEWIVFRAPAMPFAMPSPIKHDDCDCSSCLPPTY